MRITLIISSLYSGGAERVMSTMANYWAGKGNEVTLITLYSKNLDFYELHPRENRVTLREIPSSTSYIGAVKNNLIRIHQLRRAIKKASPDAVISFMDTTNVLVLLSTRGLNLKVIVSERSIPEHNPIYRTWLWLRRKVYPWADAIVVQTDHVAKWIKNNMNCYNIVVIPNPVYIDKHKINQANLMEVIGDPRQVPTIIAMGRLSIEKGFDLLLEAFAKVVMSNPDWRLAIFGEGQERDNLSILARRLGITEKIFMPGTVKNSMHILQQADLFVMSSRYEGFPNALLEAMACGLPVISFDCPSGPREIIRDGVDGILVPPGDIDALARSMEHLMKDPDKRKRLGSCAIEVRERFSLENVMQMWDQLLIDVIERRKRYGWISRKVNQR